MFTSAKTTISRAESDTNWKDLYRVGGAAALIQVVLIPVQIIIFFAWMLVLPGTVLLDSFFGVSDLSFIVPILAFIVLSAFGLLLLAVFAGFARDLQRPIGLNRTSSKSG